MHLLSVSLQINLTWYFDPDFCCARLGQATYCIRVLAMENITQKWTQVHSWTQGPVDYITTQSTQANKKKHDPQPAGLEVMWTKLLPFEPSTDVKLGGMTRSHFLSLSLLQRSEGPAVLISKYHLDMIMLLVLHSHLFNYVHRIVLPLTGLNVLLKTQSSHSAG